MGAGLPLFLLREALLFALVLLGLCSRGGVASEGCSEGAAASGCPDCSGCSVCAASPGCPVCAAVPLSLCLCLCRR